MIKREQPCTHAHRARTPRERRGEVRLLCSDLLELAWSTPSGARRREVAIIEDFSGSGASLFLGVSLDPMSDVTLRAGERVFHGIARYCDRQQNGYIVGVEFDPEARAAGYEPEHLLDVADLDFAGDE